MLRHAQIESSPALTLAADDDCDSAGLLGAWLSMHFPDAPVRDAYGGQRTLAVANSGNPHVGILDIEVPEFDEKQRAEELRKLMGHSPLHITALPGNISRVTALRDSGVFEDRPSKPVKLLENLVCGLRAGLNSAQGPSCSMSLRMHGLLIQRLS